MFIHELIAGDILQRQKDGIWHLGLYLGNGQVLQNTPGPDGGERVTSFANFAKGQPVWVNQPTPAAHADILRRAWQIVANPKPYSYLWRNCEHTVYEIVEGRPRSPTVQKLIMWTAVGVAGFIAYKYRREIVQAFRQTR